MWDARSEKYTKKAAQGAIWLIIKRILIQVIFTTSNILLARLLFPADFGTYAIILFVGIVFSVFSDLGFGPSLIQRKDNLKVGDLRTSFTIHLLLCFTVTLIIFLAAPYIAVFYKLGGKGELLLRLYSLNFLFGPFKTVSGALLERKFSYKKLVSIEVVEGFFGSLTSVIFALLGFGVFSFIIGSIVGHIASSILYLIFSPWPIGLAIDFKRLKSLTKFGFSYQMNLFYGLFYGPLIFLYLGKAVGPVNLGYYQFAVSLSVLPIALSESVNRIIFPLGSRSQEDKAFFRKIVENSLLIVSFSTLPIVVVLFASATTIIHLIYTDKWLPALPAVYFGLLQMGIVAYTGLFSQLLASLGKVEIIRKMGFVWAVLTVTLAPIFIHFFNFVGMSIAALIVSFSGVWFCFMLKKEVRFSFWENFLPYFVSAYVAGVVIFLAKNIWPYSFLGLILQLCLGGTVYLLIVLALAHKRLNYGLKTVVDILKSSN